MLLMEAYSAIPDAAPSNCQAGVGLHRCIYSSTWRCKYSAVGFVRVVTEGRGMQQSVCMACKEWFRRPD